MDEELTGRQKQVVTEIQRVAQALGVDRLSQREFDEHHRLAGTSTAGYQFGSWNRAVRAAGLEPYEPGGGSAVPKFSDEELLLEIVRLHNELEKRPSEREMARFGRFSPKPYKARWGSWLNACQTACERFADSLTTNPS